MTFLNTKGEWIADSKTVGYWLQGNIKRQLCICSKCKVIADPRHHRRACLYGVSQIHDWQLLNNMNDNITLQLVIIDLGTSTVVKVEKLGAFWQRVPINGLFRISKDADTVCYCHEGESDLVYAPFTEVRAAIDRLTKSDPPVPHIERCELKTAITGQPTYYVHHSGDGQVLWISQTEYDALSKLAGKPLPIWTPLKGVWVKLMDGIGQHAATDVLALSVWRFTITAE